MAVTSREGLKRYALTKLGHPVIHIDVSEDQMEDRLDDALDYFMEFHFDGVERYYLKHQVTAEDVTNRYVEIGDPLIIAVNKVFPFSNANINFFSVQYQVRLQDFYNFNNVSVIHYFIARSHLALLDYLFNVIPRLSFNRKQNKIYLDANWSQDIHPGDFLVFECFRALDPEAYTTVYNDRWLKSFTAALFKLQWGNNLSKFNGIVLPGNVALDGQRILADAKTEIEELKRECLLVYQMPIDMEVG